MTELGYEIKHGKHISYRHKDKERFTRAKTTGEDYTEEKIKERINESSKTKDYTVKKRTENIIEYEE